MTRARRGWYLLLLLPFAGLLLPVLYNRPGPTLFGLPFFYWYQWLWVLMTPVVIGTVLVATREDDA